MNFGAFEAVLDGRLIDVTTSPGVETRHRQTTAVQKPLPSPDYPSSSTSQSRDSDDMVSEASKKWTLDLLVFSSNHALSS